MKRLLLPLLAVLTLPTAVNAERSMLIKSQECEECEYVEGFVSPENISEEVFKMVGKNHKLNSKEAVKIQKKEALL